MGYRMCPDDRIVAKFIDANYVPSQDDMSSLETCFQANILSCTDVPGQECPVHPDCQDGWGCMNATSWFTCGPHDNGRCMSKGDKSAQCNCHQGDGTVLRDRVKLPDGFRSNH